MERDRNLLFGIFAVQLKQVTPIQLMEVAGAWAVEPERDLSQRLAEAGYLSEHDRQLLSGLVDQAVRAHDGNATKALETFGGQEQVHRSYRGSIVLTASDGVSRGGEQAAKLAEADPDSVPAVQEAPGRYTHISEYAHGGMGRVLLVQDLHIGREIALKELLPLRDTGTGETTPVRLSVPHMARFLQEARITGQLEHPSVVPVYELGHRKNGTLYYTMKLVRGKTLAQAIAEAETLTERLKLLSHFADLCQAIAYAHSRGVVHRDIKPSNVMVGEFGETVVLDWGLAKAKDKEDVHAGDLAETLRIMNLGGEKDVAKTAYGAAIGTPAYMPPEQAKGLLDQVDERSDVYSLGAVLYELLTGSAPFEGGTLHEILEKVVAEEPPLTKSLGKSVPPELLAIRQRAMKKNPAERYQSARELAEDVERYLSGALVLAHEYRLTEHLRRFARRNKSGVAVALSASLVLAAAIGFSYAQTQHAQAVLRRQMLSTQRQLLTKAADVDRKLGVHTERLARFGGDEAFRVRLAVEPFETQGDWPKGIRPDAIASSVQGGFEEELLRLPRFSIVIVQERAEILVHGSVSYDDGVLRVEMGMTDAKTGATIVEPLTEEVADVVLEEDKTILEMQALAVALKGLVLQILDAYPLLTGQITRVQDDRILVNLGAEHGLKEHMRLVAFAEEEPWIDDETGKVLADGYLLPLAEFRVEKVYSSNAQAVFEGQDPGLLSRVQNGATIVTK